MKKILRASSAGYPCDRYIWYSVNGVKGSKVSEHTQRVFDTGTCLEPFVVDCLRHDNWEVIYNPGSQEAADELTYELQNGILAGHYDCFISKGEMQDVLADIKTMNDRAFMKWRQEGTKKNQPKYYDQLHVYAGAAIQSGYSVKHLAIVGFNKNNSEIYIDIFDYTAELRGGAKIYIDVKRREKGASKWWKYNEPELALEIWSVCPDTNNRGKQGWTLSDESNVDYIFYVFDKTDCEKFFRFSFQELRRVFIKNKQN